MKFMDPHIHMTSRTTDDYEAMAKAGVRVVLEPAFWLGQPRTSVGTFEDYFLTLLGWERFRAGQFGMHYFCTLSVNPKESNLRHVAEGVMKILPRYIEKEIVVGIGEIGFDDQSELEERFFNEQLEMAKTYNLPVLIHTPHRDKKEGARKIIQRIRELNFPENLALIDHNTEDTLPLVRETGCWAGHSIYPHTKMTEERMTALIRQYGPERIIVNSAADWGISDCLKVPSTADEMIRSGFSEEEVERVLWHNPIDFFAQSGRIDKDELARQPKIDQTRLYEGSSVLRGQKPIVEE